MLPSIKCNKCGEKKPQDNFYKVSGYTIKTCNKCYSKIRKKRNKEIAKRKKAAKWF